MSITVDDKCKYCKIYWQNIQIYNRKKYEKEGFICLYCKDKKENNYE